MSSPQIVFVDDDVNILNAVQRLFKHQPYHCVVFDRGAKAIAYLKDHPVQVVVTDLRMPEMDGLELLRLVEQSHPDIIRVVLSAYSDRESLLDSINNGRVYRYILKPWDAIELISVIRQSVDVYALRREHLELTSALARRNETLERRVEERTERLMAIEKEAELGKYTSQIVHSLKVPLQSIGGAVLMANLLLNEDDAVHTELKRYLDSLLASAGELQKVIAGIIAHTADEQFMRKDRVDVNQIVRRELEFFDLDEEFKLHVQKVVELDDQLPAVLGNPLQIKQIVDNLIANAIDAMADTSTKKLTVTTSCATDTICLSIADTGCGIPKKDHEKIFSPYFTTKPLGKGTGIGLASVHKMVHAYGGGIDVDSAVGRGTTVTVRLPVSPVVPDDEP
ncbi:MAG: hybrid sensor histidine kinase/response regulator [Spirochaetaceae bacterium]|nr:MAG: hybrid sensor histidine kinase/response regulator [Spirochaetaceae bacterium]